MCKKCASTNCSKCQTKGRRFSDRATFDSRAKTAVSVRDGVQEYLGIEIGMIPEDRVFTVYRSPATIANAANMMAGIPLTNEHVDITDAPIASVGKVIKSTMIDLVDESLGSTVAVQNQIEVSQQMLSALQSGKRELSLGYTAELVEHNHYDFEQRNIEPHHLAVVDQGRCGAHCSFTDTGGQKMPKKFKDVEGNPNLEEIVQMISGLPEAMKKLDMEQLAKIMPMLSEVMTIAQTSNQSAETVGEIGQEGMEGEDMENPEVKDPEVKDMETEAKDMETKDMDEEEVKDEEPKVKDEDKKTYSDKAFKDAVRRAIDTHTMVIEKARDFVDEGYKFQGKTTVQIMRDAIAADFGSQKFSDSELPVAFRLLKRSGPSLKTFGDSQDAFTKLKDKEL